MDSDRLGTSTLETFSVIAPGGVSGGGGIFRHLRDRVH
jgi:hypothetical protein